MTKKSITRSFFVALAALSFYGAQAEDYSPAIEHIGDRYIIHVENLELNGEESLLDVLMMCPDLMSLNGTSTLPSGTPNLGYYALRVNNIDINTDTEIFLKNTKASELKTIKVVVNPGIQKGSGGLKKVIDLNFRTGENGTHGKVAVEGDTKASGEVFGRVITKTDRAWVMGQVAGKLAYTKHAHEAVENANVNVNLDLTSKDNLQLQASQVFNREREDGEAAAYDRLVSLTACYTRSLSDNGAYAMLQIAGDYTTGDKCGTQPTCSRSTSPYGVIEFGFPFFHKNTYVTAGIETGYSAATSNSYDEYIKTLRRYTDSERYEDFYAQVDWSNGQWGVSVGDRFRVRNFWLAQRASSDAWEHTTTNNYATATVWCNINPHHTIQVLGARRFYGVGYDQMRLTSEAPSPEFVKEFFTKSVYTNPIYIAEARYTYQRSNFNIMALVKNEHQNLSALEKDNILTTGVSAFIHAGVFRMTVGVNYMWEQCQVKPEKDNFHWVSLHFAPQLSLKKEWRITANAVYNSRRANEGFSIYREPNFYLDVAVSKKFNKHWLVEAKFHDIVDQVVGTRGASLGATYFF